MKKFILFPIYLVLFLSVACFTNKEHGRAISFMSISDAKCSECSVMERYNELDEFINSMRGIQSIEYYVSDDETTLIVTIKYNYKTIQIESIRKALKLKGFSVEDLY
tara:strand:- start:1457 stop:1777 length:321 start_codon:yes stop_codon:yes gene_type:complete